MSRKNTGAILGVVMIFSSISHALAAPKTVVLDQQQSIIDLTIGGLTIGGQSDQKLAQVVIAGLTGTLTAVSLPVACADGGVTVQ